MLKLVIALELQLYLGASVNNKLLPPSATEYEQNIAEVNSQISDIDISSVNKLWNADTCPLALLPWLAWAEQVPEFSSDWSEATQRSSIKAIRSIRRKRGTAGAVIQALNALNLGVKLEEWHQQQPKGTPGTFRLNVELSDTGLTQEEQDSIERIVKYAKNTRSHWDVLNIIITQHGNVNYGSTLQSGDETTLYPLIITEIEQSMPALHAMTMYDVEKTTINPLTN